MSITPAQMQNARLIYSMAVGSGLSHKQALEVVASAFAESHLNAGATNPTSKAAGLFQLLSPGYRQRANASGGLYDPRANTSAILPDFVRFFRTHPNAAPGVAGEKVERSGMGPGFYSSPLSLFQNLSGGPSGGLPPSLPSGGSQGQVEQAAPSPALTQALLASVRGTQQGQRLNLSLLPKAAVAETTAPAAQAQEVTQRSRGVSSQGNERVSVSRGANRRGVGIKPIVLNFVGQVADVFGHPLTVGTGSNHHQYVAGEGHTQSEHWTGNAVDIPASGATLTKLGQDALIAAGMPVAQARAQKGGVFNLTKGGLHIQVLFNTRVGGNHYNHLHIGVH
jgi:hypothetical protein